MSRQNKERAPLFELLQQHYSQNRTSFHVPGHKKGKGLDPLGDDFLANVMKIDYTEITGLDDLHHPEGAILKAERLAADCFGADESYFLVNGSTAGNIAMILTICSAEDTIIVQRNVHKSIIHGLMLAGVYAVFLPSRWDEVSSVATGVEFASVVAAMDQYPEAKGVLLSNPNYYGMGIDLAKIAAAVHLRGMPLLIDEAHGAHYGFHPQVPQSALAAGADIVVQSTHKMLTAMTMGAMLHVQGNRIDRKCLQQRLSMVQSSSPSYPIMASLDLCRRWMHIRGKECLSKVLKLLADFRGKVNELQAISIVEMHEHTTAYETLDPFKITLRDRTQIWSGYQLKQKLEMMGCDVEMADPSNVLLHFSLASDEEDTNRLLTALQQIDQSYGPELPSDSISMLNNNNWPLNSSISQPILMKLPQSGKDKLVKQLELNKAAGMRAAEMIVPYPPGIPILLYGETITQQIVDYLQEMALSGAMFQGAGDKSLQTIAVF